MQPLPDIDNETKIEFFIRCFYDKVMKDDLLAEHFNGINFEHHVPRMIQFWSFILLDKPGYTGNVFDKHVHLKIGKEHFDRWLRHFHEVMDSNFYGEKASLAKQRADLLGYTFESKMEQLKNKE